MRTLILGLLASGIAGCSGSSGPAGETTTFAKSYGGPLHDEATVVLNTEDGGFVLLGSADGADVAPNRSELHRQTSPQLGDFWLQKLDANGNVEFSRTIGERTIGDIGTTWRRARPTPDGGVILIGTQAVTQTVTRGDASGGADDVYVNSYDIAVTKLDANGDPVWSVTHDSGPWLNYDFFSTDGLAAAARDSGEDVWPMADGGFLIAGTSRAHLEDRHGIGFPCFDAELEEISSNSCEDIPPNRGFRFLNAYSAVVLRLNSDGSVRWRQRLTDNAFDREENRNKGQIGLNVRVRGTADDGAVVARAVDGGMLVHRLRADSTVRWRSVVDLPTDVLHVSDAGLQPTSLIQTDDPVDGPDGDEYDGVRDDGFALTVYAVNSYGLGGDDARVIKLDADGEVQWNIERDDAFLNDLTQHCIFAEPDRCEIVAVGTAKLRGDAGLFDRAYAVFLDEDGDVRTEAFPQDNFDDPPRALTRIGDAGVGGFRFPLLGVSFGDLVVLELDARPSQPVFFEQGVNNDGGSPDREGLQDHLPDWRPDGSIVMLTDDGQRLKSFDMQAQLQADVFLKDNITTGEVLRAGVQIGPGRFVLTGTRPIASGRKEVMVLRYDLDDEGGHLVWQRHFVPTDRHDEQQDLDVLAAVPSSDGGVVLSLFRRRTANEDPEDNGLLVKLDADGNVSWQEPLSTPTRQLHRLPDGGFATLSFRDSLDQVVRFSADGGQLWRRTISLTEPQGPLEALASAPDGALVLVGSFGARITLVRLAADGESASATDLQLPGNTHTTFDDLHIQQATDGGFVLAMSATDLVLDGALETQVSRGQSNVLVLRLDASLQPVWATVHGFAFDEGVRDLALHADGTIAVAGYSDSLGDRREAWLLKLSPHGLISEVGCQAQLLRIAPSLISVSPREVTVARANSYWAADELYEPPEDISLPLRATADFITARQCLGNSGAGGGTVPPPVVTSRLSVQQVGNAQGVVTSVPAGISCGAGADICAADFAQGTRVQLRADVNRFLRWETPCEDNTGGESLQCVVTLDVDRVVQVNFAVSSPPPPPARFTLSFSVLGPGIVRTDEGINCTEGGPADACSREYVDGSLVNVSAEALPGQRFLGWTSGNNDDSLCLSFAGRTPIQIPMTRDVHCSARFVGTGERRLAVTVAGEGLVRDEPSAVVINCREGGSAAECEEIYTATETVALRASADAGWRFDGWGGDCADNGDTPVISVVTAQSLTCSATFVPIVSGSTLTVQIVNGAAGRMVESLPIGIMCGDGNSDCSETFAPDTVVTLQATRSGFQSWLGCPQVMDINFCRVIMNQSHTVTATYSP